jgi:multimeric flavodoxin WrbA/uncharacterized Zn finger protein (UPF0148 family)
MKILGLACGSKNGNSEILLKEALMGAEELGVDGEILRLLDLDVKPCMVCRRCLWREKGPDACVLKDDGPFVWNKVMDCDGLIISAPVYAQALPGYIKTIGDRALGTKADVAMALESKRMQGSGAVSGPDVDERIFKNRAGAFISVAGNPNPKWLALGLSPLHTVTFPLHIAIVDQIQLGGAAAPGTVVFNEKAMERVRQLGRHVAEAMGKPFDEVPYKGDDPGTCPVCHSNLLVVTKKNPVACPICGISGEIKVVGDEITVTFSEEEQKKSRLMIKGEQTRSPIIRDAAIKFERRKDELAVKLEKYKSYGSYIKPPSKLKKAEQKML